MLLELIATFTVGFGVAGISLLAIRLSGRRLPRWMTPASAGLAMIAFTIWSEYHWFTRTTEALPEQIIVTSANEASQPYRPWTYLFPQVNRFVAMDTTSLKTNPKFPDQVMVNLLLMARWAPGVEVPVLFDCAGGRRADLLDGITIASDGAVEGADWTTLAPEDPALAEACSRRG